MATIIKRIAVLGTRILKFLLTLTPEEYPIMASLAQEIIVRILTLPKAF